MTSWNKLSSLGQSLMERADALLEMQHKTAIREESLIRKLSERAVGQHVRPDFHAQKIDVDTEYDQEMDALDQYREPDTWIQFYHSFAAPGNVNLFLVPKDIRVHWLSINHSASGTGSLYYVDRKGNTVYLFYGYVNATANSIPRKFGKIGHVIPEGVTLVCGSSGGGVVYPYLAISNMHDGLLYISV